MKICRACGHFFAADGWECPHCGAAPRSADGFPVLAPDLGDAQVGYDVQLHADLAALESGHFWFESRSALIVWALTRFFPHARSLLEIGCGTGFVLAALQQSCPQLELYGSDIFTSGLAFAQQRVPRAHLMQMDARRIPFDSHFDVIGAFDVLEHIAEDAAALGQMFQAVRPGGGVLITVPQHPFLWSPFDEWSRHERRYTRAELAGKITGAGFKLERVSSFCCLTLPAMMLSRRRGRRAQAVYEPLAELKVSGPLNRMLRRVLRLERWGIRAGLRWPCGGSLLAAATKPANAV